MKKQIYIDMDGTLCRFHDVEHKYIEQMWEPGFYRNLKPFSNFLNGVALCIGHNPDVEFFILSAVLETEPPFAEHEKREWLKSYLPQIPESHIIFTPAGTDKASYIPNLDKNCYLIDDYNKNLREWADAGGESIKFINDINNRGLGAYGGEKGELWQGASICYDASPMEISNQIETCAEIERQQYRKYMRNEPEI